MDRDAERSAVYAAELAAFDGTDLEEIRPFGTIETLAAGVIDGDWWPGGTVEVRRARSDARSSSTRCASDRADATPNLSTIRLAAPQMTVATLAHELAHVLAGVGRGHDAIYRRAFLDVVAMITNLDTVDRRRDVHVDQLADAFNAAGLRVGERAWPAPPPNTTGAIAL